MPYFYFYKLGCSNTQIESTSNSAGIPRMPDFYIGSTKNLQKRMNLHKSHSNKSKTKLYVKMREFGGINNWKFIILFRKNLDNRRQAEKIEYDLFDLLKPTLNTQRCFNSNGRCIHKRIKSQCLECKGTRVCPHNRIKNQCKECHGTMICSHNTSRHHCKKCSPFHCDTCDITTSKGNRFPHFKSKKHINNIMERLVEIKQRIEDVKQIKYLKMIQKISNQQVELTSNSARKPRVKGDIIHLNKLTDNQLSEIEQLLDNIENKNRKSREINFYD